MSPALSSQRDTEYTLKESTNKIKNKIFAFPNFLPMLEKKQTNCLNFEHTVFLTEHITEYILRSCGFEVIDKKYFNAVFCIVLETK